MSGFHEGELAVQELAGVRAEADRLQGMLAPPHLDGGPSRFLGERTFAALTGRDPEGRLWTSPLVGPPGFLDADATTLRIHALPLPGDPLRDLPVGQAVGLIAMDYARRRRIRINGVLAERTAEGLRVDVEQAFGNCPKYIRPRRLAADAAPADHGAPSRSATLSADAARRCSPARRRSSSAPRIPSAASTRPTAAGRPASSGSRTARCGGRTTRATTCSTASATSRSTTRRRCSSPTSPGARACCSPAVPSSSGWRRARRATTAAPAAASGSPWSRR